MSLINPIVAPDFVPRDFNPRVIYALWHLVLMHLAIKCASLIVRTKTNKIAICQNICSQELLFLHFSTLLAFILLALDSFALHIYFQH
jgi:hypothetical protein